MENKEQKQIQVNVDPNAYMINMVNMGFDEEMFHFLITSGNQGRQFVATPKHAKRISMLLEKQIKDYEAKFGEIKTQLPETPQMSHQDESNKIGF